MQVPTKTIEKGISKLQDANFAGDLLSSVRDTNPYGEINALPKNIQPGLVELLARFAKPAGKKSFLVFRANKYFTVSTDSIAFFYVKYTSTIIVCFDKQEYSVNHSLEQIQQMISEEQFFRVNRQYLVNFNAVKEVEYYYARKLLVNLVVIVPDSLLVPKEKVTNFLHWLDNR